MKVHWLKTWPEQFAAVRSGAKLHEVRRNDRDFEVGDELVLQEYEPTAFSYTGEETIRLVTHITPAGAFGLPPDICVMSHVTAPVRARQGYCRDCRLPCVIRYGGGGEVVTLALVRDPLREMLAVFEALRRLGFAARDIFVTEHACMAEDPEVVVPATILKTQGKEFVITAGCPYVGPDFVAEFARVGALWNDPAAEAERQEIWLDSVISRKGVVLIMALERKGFVLPCAVEILEKKRPRP